MPSFTQSLPANIRTLMLGALLWCSFVAPVVAGALDENVSFEIPAQSLENALFELSKQSSYQIVFSSGSLPRRQVAAVSGKMPVKQALNLLLNGTELGYKLVGEKTITVGKGVGATPAAGRKTNEAGAASAAAGPAADLRLAQGPDAATGGASAKGEKSRAGDGVEEMLVEGEREKPAPFSTANLDLTRTEDDVLPFTTFTAKDIQLSGAATLIEFFRNRLAQNFDSTISEEGLGYDTVAVSPSSVVAPTANKNLVSMRGWGSSETVFLLNGRRMPPEYQQGNVAYRTDATPNLKAIPLGSIERIEILTSAGSAIYGGSATGGVINIITRQDFRGGQMSLSYDTPADTQAPKRSVSMSYGLPLKWGLGLRLAAGYGDITPIRAEERADVTVLRWRRLMLERYGIANMVNFFGYLPLGATPNLRRRPGESRGPLYPVSTTRNTTVPDGYTGSGGIEAFTPDAYNLELAEGSHGNNLAAKNSTLGNDARDWSFGFGIDRNFGSRWRWSLDYRRDSSQSFQPPSGMVQVSGSGPFAYTFPPNGVFVSVYMIDQGLERPELKGLYSNDNSRWSSTLRGGFGDWVGFLDLSYSRNENETRSVRFQEPVESYLYTNPDTGVPVQLHGWQAAFSKGTYRPLVDARVMSPAAPEFYENYIQRRDRAISGSRASQAALRFSGPALHLPAGGVQLTMGTDFMRSDRSKSIWFYELLYAKTGEPYPLAGQPGNPNIGDVNDPPNYKFTHDNYGLYAETDIPVVSREQNLPLVKGLGFFASGRMNETKSSGFRDTGERIESQQRTHVHAYGLRYDMIEGVALRASKSIGFRPMTAAEMTPSLPTTNSTYTDSVYDPQRKQRIDLNRATQVLMGGNPDLRPETTDSMNMGIILAPRWMAGTRLSLNYVENVRNDAITSVYPDLVAQLESFFPQRVVRGAPDGNVSGVGPITFVDATLANFSEISSKSLDFSLDKEFKGVLGGSLLFTASASKQLSYKIQFTATSEPFEMVRNRSYYNNYFSQSIQWNANAQVQWTGQRWSFGWNTRFFDYFHLNNSRLDDPGLIDIQGSDLVPWKLNHDANVSYRTPALGNARGIRWLMSGSTITFGIKNVFNREPRFWALDYDRGVAPFDSIEGRAIWINASRSF